MRLRTALPDFVLPVITACVTVAAVAAPATAARPAAPAFPAASTAAPAKPTVAYPHLGLPGGSWARVYSDGIAEVHRGNRTEFTRVPLASADGQNSTPAGDGARDLPPRGALISDLLHSQPQAYLPGQVVVVYADAVSAPASVAANAATLRSRTPAYTSSPALNRVLDRLGVDRARLAFPAAAQRLTFRAMRAAAQRKSGRPLLDFANEAILHVTGSSVARAVQALRARPDVAFAEPDWVVTPTDLPPVPVPPAMAAKARQQASRMAAPAATAKGVPGNFALTSSLQSLLNRPGVDAVPAFADIAARYGQLPGQGEIITNVSVGDLDDASAAANPSDSCSEFAQSFGPTTIVSGGQRYLDWPSMPLIPAYTASSDGTLDPTGETCGADPQLTEVGLDFSAMAPLPHDRQRADETGSGLTDLLGIAPGASYRLVVPAAPDGAISGLDAAFLAAAQQTPRPDVITASLGFGIDQFGFSSRYLEDDPVTASVIASIVSSGIVVTLAAGDGLRTTTNAAVAPSGGSAATNVAASPTAATSLNDVAFSGAPSADPDSGSIDVGASTLNDISAAPPNNPANAGLASQQAFPTTRFTGGRNFASGFGSRVNVSAPGDSIVSVSHAFGGAADAVSVGLAGGTSASAPETAAAAAVVLQVARLTGNKAAGQSPTAVRSFLEGTAAPLGPLPEADRPVSVGPQVDVGNAVQTLLAGANQPAAPGVARVAVAQRQPFSALDGPFETPTDPGNISLAGAGSGELITIAPDWTGLAPGASGVTYTLSGPSGRVLARTPWARLLPSAILASAGLALPSASPRSVRLTYQASRGGKALASATFTLTFSPWDGTTPSVAAPVIPAVVTGPEIPVKYDLSGLVNPASPTLVVSFPGRIDPVTGNDYSVAYSVPLTATRGTVLVPVSRLQGAGIYGLGIQAGPGGFDSSDYSAFTFIRVSPSGDARPDIPTLRAGAITQAHTLEIPRNGNFQVSYDVRRVPGATGAIAEVSAPGPTISDNINPFNNPNGSERDANGHDSGSVAYAKLPGTHGTATLNGGVIGLVPTMNHVIRILATRGDGSVIGEASDDVTVSMDGIAAADGGGVAGDVGPFGGVAGGFGVNASGDDGLITSNGGPAANSVETFSQSTGKTSTIATSATDSYETDDGACPGIVAGDTGLYADVTSSGETFHRISPVAAGTGGGAWTPPAALGQVDCVAADQASNTDAVLSETNPGGTSDTIFVTPANIAAGTFGTPVDIGPALASAGIQAPSIDGFAMNPATGQAQVAITDVLNSGDNSTMVSVDLSSGAVTTLPAVAANESGLAVNPSAGTAGVTMNGGFDSIGFTDLATGSTTLASPGGLVYTSPAAIPGTGDFTAVEVVSPDAFAPQPNDNSISSVIVTDAAGNVRHRYEDFNFFNIFLLATGGYLQVNPGTQRGFTLGVGGGQLHPFTFAK